MQRHVQKKTTTLCEQTQAGASQVKTGVMLPKQRSVWASRSWRKLESVLPCRFQNEHGSANTLISDI